METRISQEHDLAYKTFDFFGSRMNGNSSPPLERVKDRPFDFFGSRMNGNTPAPRKLKSDASFDFFGSRMNGNTVIC